jgi:hypothetical protein
MGFQASAAPRTGATTALTTATTTTKSDRRGSGAKTGSTETGGLRDWEGPLEPEGDVEDSDELRMQPLRGRAQGRYPRARRRRCAGKEACAHRTRVRIQVPKKHEEVTVEHVPVESEATGVEIGEDEEIVEEDVRREEVEVVDETKRGAGPYTAPERGGSQSG